MSPANLKLVVRSRFVAARTVLALLFVSLTTTLFHIVAATAPAVGAQLAALQQPSDPGTQHDGTLASDRLFSAPPVVALLFQSLMTTLLSLRQNSHV